jgi:hypothetical protein
MRAVAYRVVVTMEMHALRLNAIDSKASTSAATLSVNDVDRWTQMDNG